MKKVGLIFGGSSVEHEISIISALQAAENIDKSKYEVVPIYISKENVWYSDKDLLNIEVFKDFSNLSKYNEIIVLKEDNKQVIKYKEKKLFKDNLITHIDIFLPVVHGTNVEDGKLQGYLETINAKYAGPDVYSAVVGQDKAFMRDILKANNINQLKYIWVTSNEDYNVISDKIIENVSYPVIIKPALLGSSIGITVAKNFEELEVALDESFSYCYKLVIEEYSSDFREMNISVLGNYKEFKLSAIEEVAKSEEILSFDDKYQSDGSKKSSGMESLSRIIPANINKDLENKINEIAEKTFKALCASGVVRIDLMIIDEIVYINEINNIPGSLAFYLWEEKGMKYSQMLDQLIELGINRFFENSSYTVNFESNVLQNSKKGVKK